MKKFLLVAIILSVMAGTMIGLLAGRKQGIRTEEQVIYVLNAYFQAWQQLQPETMYNYISADDRKDISLAEYVTQFNQFPVRPVKYKISDILVKSISARANLIVDWPKLDGGELVSREEIFYLVCEDRGWRILENGSLQY